MAQEYSARNKTLSFAAGSAEGKLSGRGDFNTQNTRGLMFDIALSDHPLRLALDYFSGGVKITTVIPGIEGEEILRVSETALGARYYLEDLSQVVDFYAGAGLALVSANYEVKVGSVLGSGTLDLSGSDSGTYFGFGARRVFENGFALGFDYRDSDAEIKIKGGTLKVGAFDIPLSDTKGNFGLTRTSLTLGYNW